MYSQKVNDLKLSLFASSVRALKPVSYDMQGNFCYFEGNMATSSIERFLVDIRLGNRSRGKRSNYRRSLWVQACDLQFEEVFMTKAF